MTRLRRFLRHLAYITARNLARFFLQAGQNCARRAEALAQPHFGEKSR